MNKSESIKELSAAMAKAQAEMSNPKKNSANPFFKSKYADLSEVINVSKPILAAHGLSVMQLPGFDDGVVTVETVITHESGEWISSVMSMPPVKSDPQGVGSCLTYIRRYSLAAVCGIGQEDDDANEAVKQVKKTKPVKLDSKIVDSINGCESMDQLAEVWKGMSAEQHKVYASVKDNRKNELQEAA